MAVDPYYTAGTIDLTNGDATVEGSDLDFLLNQVGAGDLLFVEPASALSEIERILSVTDADTLELARAWQGATGTYSYAIYRNFGRQVAASAAANLAIFADKAKNGAFSYPLVVGTYAGRATYDDIDPADYPYPFIYAATTDVSGNPLPGYWMHYAKLSASSGDWSSGSKSAGADGEAFDYSGDGAPESGLGTNGETYFDYATGDVYAKASGSWAVQFNMIGVSADVQRRFEDNTNTAETPASAKFRLNNATLASVTQMAIERTDSRGGTNEAWIKEWDDSTSTIKGHLFMRSVSTPSKYAIYQLTGSIADNTTWLQATLVHVASNGTWAADEEFVIAFATKGDKGQAGENGAVPGLEMGFDDTTDDGAPSAGDFRLNHATPASATQVYLNETDDNGNDVASILDTLIGSEGAGNTQYGVLSILKSDMTAGLTYRVRGVVSASGYRKLNVSHVTGFGTISDGDDCFVLFMPAEPAATGAMRFQSDLANTAEADPGAGFLRYDHATFASITQAFVDDATFDGADVVALLTALLAGDGDVLADLYIHDAYDRGIFRHFEVTGFTDNTGFNTLDLTPVDDSGTMIDGDLVSVQIVPRAAENQPGIHMLLDLAAQTDADPGGGYMRWDDTFANIADVEEMFLSDDDRDGTDVSAIWAILSVANAGTRRARLRIEKRGDRTVWAEFWVDAAVVDATTYYRVPVSYIAHGGTFTDEDKIVVNWWPAGDKGVHGGDRYTLDLASTADSDTANGDIRFDNADLTAAETLFIDDLSADLIDMTAALDAMDDADNDSLRGTLRVTQLADHTVFAVYKIVGDIVNATGYRRVPVAFAYSGNEGDFSDNDEVILTFIPAGDSAARDVGGRANLIQNPLFQVDIEGNAGGVDTGSAGSEGYAYVVEGVAGYQYLGGFYTLTRIAGDSVPYAIQCNADSALDPVDSNLVEYIAFPIEGYRLAPALFGTADAKDCFFHIRVKPPVTGKYYFVFEGGDDYKVGVDLVADEWNDVDIEVPGFTTGTWNKTNGLGLEIKMCLVNGAAWWGTFGSDQANSAATINNKLYFEDPIFSIGEAITTEWAPYSDYLAECERYFQTAQPQYAAAYTSTSNRIVNLILQTTMRANPTWAYTATSGTPSELQNSPKGISLYQAGFGTGTLVYTAITADARLL